MSKKYTVYKTPHYDLDLNLLDCKFLGKGHNGIVYELPNNKAIKICFDLKSFTGESQILEKVNGNRYFPKLYEVGFNYMIRDCVDGEPLDKYISKNGLDRDMVKSILELLKEFIRLNFKKIDIRCKDIFVQPNRKLMVIDPKKFFTKNRTFPRHLSKGLYKLGVLDFFLEILKKEEPKLYKSWIEDINDYICQLENESQG